VILPTVVNTMAVLMVPSNDPAAVEKEKEKDANATWYLCAGSAVDERSWKS